MIYYFSATGNSRAVAERIAARLGEQCADILQSDPLEDRGRDAYIGFVFPIYAWAAPEVVLKFASQVKAGDAYTFAVCTFSNVTGLALQQFSEILPLKSGYGICMPDNFPVFDKIVETEESARRKLLEAKPRLEWVTEQLLAKKTGFDSRVGENGAERTYQKSVFFNEHQRKTGSFWVDGELCMHCGLCARNCPAQAIAMEDGLPVWIKESCFLCAGCINLCPAEAVQMGPYSKGKFRYKFTGFPE